MAGAIAFEDAKTSALSSAVAVAFAVSVAVAARAAYVDVGERILAAFALLASLLAARERAPMGDFGPAYFSADRRVLLRCVGCGFQAMQDSQRAECRMCGEQMVAAGEGPTPPLCDMWAAGHSCTTCCR